MERNPSSKINSNHDNLTKEQSLELVYSLFKRSRTHTLEKAEEAFRAIYPRASEKIIKALVFHVFVDGIRAALDWLAGAEILLRDRDDSFLNGNTYHLLYHVYNWQQCQEIIPLASSEVLSTFEDLKEAIAKNDREAVEEVMSELDELFQGDWDAPNFM